MQVGWINKSGKLFPITRSILPATAKLLEVIRCSYNQVVTQEDASVERMTYDALQRAGIVTEQAAQMFNRSILTVKMTTKHRYFVFSLYFQCFML